MFGQYPPSTFQNPTMDRPPALGRVFYVRSTGSDNNNGVDPQTPSQTITHALTQCVAWRNDYVVVMNNTSALEAAFPIEIDVELVHIVGLWGQPYPNPTLMAVGNFATFQINVDWVEIAGLEMGAGAAHACIESPAGPGTLGHWWIHHNAFGYIVGVTTARDGIHIQNTHDAPQCVIENNVFGTALTRDGLRVEGNSTRSIFRKNYFTMIPGIGIHCIQNGSDIGFILNNSFKVADLANGEAITLQIGVGNALISGNQAAGQDNAMGTNPYRDLSTGIAGTGLNAWGNNIADITPTLPVIV
jgi:hypothetical protein